MNAAASAPMPGNLALQGRLTASSSATEPEGKYGVKRAADNDLATHWASASEAALPQWLKVEWDGPQTVDTVMVSIFSVQAPNLYAAWKRFEIEFSDGTKVERELPPEEQDTVFLRLERPLQTTSATLRILEVYEPKVYVGVDEFRLFYDPDRRLRPPKKVARPKPRASLAVGPRRPHPCVYINRADLARARRNAERTEWGRKCREEILAAAAPWLEHEEQYWLQFLPEPGACYAYGFTGCPLCNASCGTWGGARCRWDRPRTVECARGHRLPDAEHPDDGTGYHAPDGRVHYLLGIWNAWVTEQWTTHAIPTLGHAYALTGDERYAERAAFFLDALASIYPESTSGSWDYPSSPPSGRLARPWYQVARTLVLFVEGYDLIYDSAALDRPSLRPTLEKTFPAGPTAQQRAVGTPDAHGVSRPGLTRRENIDLNLMGDGAYYCYANTFSGALHNGHADYMRGALAVGALLNIPEYVHHALESPYSIYAMIANNCDRDGRYYETALGYALHTRELYLTFTEPLRNWRDGKYPQGLNLFDDPQFRMFYILPDSVLSLAGHAPNFGDCAPDNAFVIAPERPFSASDYGFAERLHAGTTGRAKREFGGLLAFLTHGEVEKQRASSGSNIQRWLLYHADPVIPRKGPRGSPDLDRKLFGSWFLGQKGLALLRDGKGENAQGVLLRYGPSLNHGHRDDLGLLYYGKGWQLTYDIGYGLGSTHTQVGWAHQTVSHCLVTVNEASQQGEGSGGSLYLFAATPGFKVVEADSPLSYSRQNVTQYRRTVALIGQGQDQVLVDLFRVRGGRQHDYTVGAQGQDFQVAGVALGPEEEGSLAGLENAWGERQGPDGDILGYPLKPYWNPPPGNGYGFFYRMRRGPARSPWSVDWCLGGENQAHFRVHVLPEPDTEALVALAPGLYPFNRKASYLMARRCGEEGLVSNFAAVMEPYALPLTGAGRLRGRELLARLSGSRAEEVKFLPDLQVVLLKGTQPGDHAVFTWPVEKAGRYQIAARILKAASYGTVRLLVDGQPLGSSFPATAPETSGPERVVFGEAELSSGTHTFRFEMTAEAKQYYVGIAALEVVPAEEAARAGMPQPVLAAVDRLEVEGGTPTFTPIALHFIRKGDDEYLLSGELGNPSVLSVATVGGTLQWSGAAVYAAFRQGRLIRLGTHGASQVKVAGKAYGPAVAAFRGKLTRVNYAERWVETDAKLPPTGLSGEIITFSNPRYSRNTAYRIQAVEATKAGSRIHLGDQSLILGRGRVFEVVDATTMTTEIPHEYGRSVVSGVQDRFFDGKLLRSDRGQETHLTALEYGTPMRLSVDSTEGFDEGDGFVYGDVQVGDDFTVPTTGWWSAGGQP